MKVSIKLGMHLFCYSYCNPLDALQDKANNYWSPDPLTWIKKVVITVTINTDLGSGLVRDWTAEDQ